MVTTVVGWNIPNGANFNNAFETMLLTLVFVCVFATIPMLMGRRDDFVITMALIGGLVGSLFGVITLGTINGASTLGFTPFAYVVLNGAVLVLWLWHGARG